MKSGFVVSFSSMALLLIGCSDPKLSEYELPDEVERSALKMCFLDVEVVPVENSENCGFVSRELAAWSTANVCERNETLKCRKLRESFDNSYGFFWQTVARSLFKYGRPNDEKILEAGLKMHRPSIYYLYGREGSLDRLFQACLKEQTRLQESALNTDSGARFQRVTTIVPRALNEGQICIERDFDQRSIG